MDAEKRARRRVRRRSTATRIEEEARLLQSLVLAVSKSGSLQAALFVSLRKIAEEAGWDCAEAWLRSLDGCRLEAIRRTYGRSTKLASFTEAIEDKELGPGQGLPGRVWISRKPIWIPDLASEPTFLRGAVARELGLRSGVGVPVEAADGVVAVLAFYSCDMRPQDERFIRLATVVGAQLGLLIQRRRTEDALQAVLADLDRQVKRRTAELAALDANCKKLQEEIVQSRALAAIGEVAASISHEIRNPLAAISGATQIIRESLAPDDPRRQPVDGVLAQIRRLEATVRQLLMLARPWKPRPEPCDLREEARRVAAMAAEDRVFERIRFAYAGEESLRAPVDRSLLEQVLWNLLQNSAHAMPDGGEIRIGFASEPGAAVVTLADSGRGIPPDVEREIFRPFVTTKAHGTGLGLPICRKIMEAHGGTISLSSEPGRGTTVTLRFPR